VGRDKWLGMEDTRNICVILVGKRLGGHYLGRPKRTWEDNTKLDLREDRKWI
jgi:hypothetical protein